MKRGGPVRTFFRQGGFFRNGHPHFWVQTKLTNFSKFSVSARKGVEPVRTFFRKGGKVKRGEGRDSVRTCFMIGPLNRC